MDNEILELIMSENILLNIVSIINMLLAAAAFALLLDRFAIVRHLQHSPWKYISLLGAFSTFFMFVAFFRIVFTGMPSMLELDFKVSGLLVYIIVSSIVGIRKSKSEEHRHES